MNFLLWLQPEKNEWIAEQVEMNLWEAVRDHGGSGGLGSIYLRDSFFISHLKVNYLMPGTDSPDGPGVIFRQHFDNVNYRTAGIYWLSDAFEFFLNKQDITYRRVNRKKFNS